jgi:acylphosphatase
VTEGRLVKGVVSGKVQGVGFRFFVQRQANQQGVTGYAKNLPSGEVEVLLCGNEESLWEMKKQVLKGPLISRVDGCTWEDLPFEPQSGFQIL